MKRDHKHRAQCLNGSIKESLQEETCFLPTFARQSKVYMKSCFVSKPHSFPFKYRVTGTVVVHSLEIRLMKACASVSVAIGNFEQVFQISS